MLSGHLGQPDDRIGMDVDQASGLSDAAAFGEVLKHGAGLRLGQMGLEQRRALALREAVLAGLAIEQADGLVLAVAPTNREVSGVALAVERAIGSLASEARDRPWSRSARWAGARWGQELVVRCLRHYYGRSSPTVQ
jgi:hypothetical protein